MLKIAGRDLKEPVILTVLHLELNFLFSLLLWHYWILHLVWSEEMLVTQAVHIPACIIVVISSTVASNFKCRGKQEWKWTFLRVLITAKLPTPFAPDTSNFNQEPVSWFLSPSINLAESYNCDILMTTTWNVPLWITSALKPIAGGKRTPCLNKSVKVVWKRRKARDSLSDW